MKEKGMIKYRMKNTRSKDRYIYIYIRQYETERIKYVQRNKYIYRILQNERLKKYSPSLFTHEKLSSSIKKKKKKKANERRTDFSSRKMGTMTESLSLFFSF